MFSPDDIDYSRLDVSALLEMHGIAAVDVLREQPCQRWLVQKGYSLTFVDFGRSFEEILADFGSIFDWQRQFGYRLEESKASLDAFADGFSFPISRDGGSVLVVRRPESLASTHADWFDGFLQIASGHSLLHLACGSTFFVVLVVGRESALPGRAFGEWKVPCVYWNPNARKHGFLE